MVVHNFWFFVFLILALELLWVRKLSSYNRKWLIFYTLSIFGFYTNYDVYEMEDAVDLIGAVLFFPLCIYITYSVLYKYIKNWKPIVWIDKLIDWIYTNIKELS